MYINNNNNDAHVNILDLQIYLAGNVLDILRAPYMERKSYSTLPTIISFDESLYKHKELFLKYWLL